MVTNSQYEYHYMTGFLADFQKCWLQRNLFDRALIFRCTPLSKTIVNIALLSVL